MSRIRLLSEQVANQIAAGEVVERPASVVKELVENSLDAEATRIEVHIEGGGLDLIRVTDDGFGMDGDDLLLAVERHATSKLRQLEDLQAIATLGFRGEALPSIASVSHLIIVSRPRGQELGTRVELRHGVLHAVREEGCPTGTRMEARQLFAQVPARRKFLKSARTELFQIEEVIKNQALAHPERGFSLSSDGRSVLAFAPGAALKERVSEVFRYQHELLALDTAPEAANPSLALKLWGYLLLPERSPTLSAKLRLFVNGRPIQDTMLRHAVQEGMQGFLMKGYQAAGALFLETSAQEVDVNVHPAKKEVRFRQPDAVRRCVIEAVRTAMARHQERLRRTLFDPGPEENSQQFLHVAEPSPRDFFPKAAPGQLFAPTPTSEEVSIFTTAQSGRADHAVFESLASCPPPSAPLERLTQHPHPENQGSFSGLRLIGQLFSLYLLCERQGQFILIDQHAAHERLLHGQFRRSYLSGGMARQALLLPLNVELEPLHHELAQQQQHQLAALGFELLFFGERTWVIQQVPALMQGLDPLVLLQEVLDGLGGQPRTSKLDAISPSMDQLFASLACKAAIRAGNRLQPEEMLALLAQMEASDIFSYCPHGRPVIKAFSSAEVEKWFHRHGGSSNKEHYHAQ